MLEKVDLSKALSKAESSRLLPALRTRLFDVQRTCWEGGVSSIVLLEGLDASGKGTAVNALTQQLEPRGFRLHAIKDPRSHERSLPWLQRFWALLPAYGEMAIFDESWYRRVLHERVAGMVSEPEWRRAYANIVDLERTLADDGAAIIKLFLHIDQKEQHRRLKRLEKDPLTSWQVTPEVWARHRRYPAHVVAVEEMLERTDSELGPWTIVEATDRRWARARVFETIISGLDQAAARRGLALPADNVIRQEAA